MIKIIGFVFFIILAIILVKRKNNEDDYGYYDSYSYGIVDTYVKRGRKSC